MRRLALSILFLGTAAAAAPMTREEVPSALAPWVGWALKGHEESLCAALNGQERRACAWPGALRLSLEDKSGRFEQSWTAQAEVWASLPGDRERWPQDVRVDGAPAVVLDRGQGPAVRLKPGAHAVSGSFRWDRLPEQLDVPAETGLLALVLRGAPVPFPTRDESGRLWLQQKARAESAKEESHLEVAVHRLLIDEAPLELVTRVQLRVSGGSREVLLGPALPEGFTPMSLISPLPARLEADGRLRVQARAGTWDLVLTARGDAKLAEIAAGEPKGPWDADEAWVFEARPSLRLAEVEGVPSLDPQQTELPHEWRSFPAYLITPGAKLRLAQRRRGDDPPAPDRLSLQRELWLDFEGRGYSARDRITGTLARSWRLEAAPETKLGRVAVDGVDQFLTALSSGGSSGLEMRASGVSVVADSRVEGRRLPATGWKHDFESVSARLHLPPGWRLLHAGGVDQASPTWVTSWSLLDLFLVLIAAAAFSRLWDRRWGLAALAGVALAWHEPGAPRWAWLAALLFLALDRALAGGSAAKWAALARRAAWGILVLVCVPFLVKQARVALYPDLELPYSSVQPRDAGQVDKGWAGGAFDEMAPASPEEVEYDSSDGGAEQKQEYAKKSFALSAVRGAASAMQAYRSEPAPAPRRKALNQLVLDPNARVTTGAGLPYWTWREARLSWKGPVPQGQRVSLWLLSPSQSFTLALIRCALIVVLVLLLGGVPVGEWLAGLRGPEGRERLKRALLPLLLLLALPLSAAAQGFPGKEIIDELRNRLLERPSCAPNCAESPKMRLEAQPGWLKLTLELHAAAATAVPLPAAGREWAAERATLDGKSAPVRRLEDGSLWVPLTPGAHQLTLEGPLPARDSVQLGLPLRPHRVESSVSGWTLHGVRDDGRPEDTLQLARVRGAQASEAAAARAQGIFPPFLRVERVVTLGLSWSVRTTVTRMTPAGSPVSAAIPLLPGESVTSSDLRVVKGKAQVSLPPQAASLSWSSTLAETDTLRLAAAETSQWAELWRVEPNGLWHVEAKGIPTVHEDPGSGARARVYRPWPGESVDLSISRPGAVPGQTLTIDQSQLTLSPGVRATDATLSLSVRSSRGTQHVVTLPEGSDLLSAKVDGALQPLRLEGRTLSVPIQPGAHAVELVWRQPGGARLFYRAPEALAGASSVNAHTQISMPQGRWTLLLGGAGMGPAVVFWSLLTVFLLVSVGLGKTELSPLSWKHWFLLSLGLTQIGVGSAAIVAGWFLAMGLRGKRPPQQGRELKLASLFLGFWTLAAAACLFASIKRGLLGAPDMQIAGNGSSAQLLRWYLDRAGDALPRPWVFSVPLWVYRVTMLAWALWLAESLLRWSKWAWGCFVTGGAWEPKAAD